MIRKRFDRLHTLDVKKPCPANWDEMVGDEAKRFCKHCQKHVHNISAMTKESAEKLLQCNGDHLCVRYSSDRFGRLITLNGLIPRLAAAATFGAALVASGFSTTREVGGTVKIGTSKPKIEKTVIQGNVATTTPADQANHTTGMVSVPVTMGEVAPDPKGVTPKTGVMIKPKPSHHVETPTAPNQRPQQEIMGAIAPPDGTTTKTKIGRHSTSTDQPKRR